MTVRTLPDWWGRRRSTSGIVTEDVGEAAARLGSPVTADRMGDVLHINSFEYGMGIYGASNSGTVLVSKIDVNYPRTGGFNYRIAHSTVAAGTVTIQANMGLITRNRLGFEFNVSLVTQGEWLINRMGVALDGIFYQGELRIKDSALTIEYLNSGGTYTQIDTIGLTEAISNAYTTCKLVIDVDTQEYVRALFGHHQFDLSGIALRNTGVTNGFRLFSQIESKGNNPSGGIRYIDDLIVTQNEP